MHKNFTNTEFYIAIFSRASKFDADKPWYEYLFEILESLIYYQRLSLMNADI